jgi:hypothetical protein
MTKLLLSGLASCVLMNADFAAQSWHYRRPLTLTQSPISEFVVDSNLYRDSAANLDDLRVLRDNVETPYVILTLSGSRQSIERPAAIINKAWLPDTGVQAVLDLKGNAEHNRIRIETPLRNFKENVRVETSDDAHNWAVVESAGLIFDVSRDDHAVSESTISYPPSTRRFVRLTIPGWKEPANLQAVWLSSFKETGATRDVIASLNPTTRQDVKAQTTELTLDLGFQGQPYDTIDLTVDPGLFIRSVEIAGSNDGQQWYSTSGNVISRTTDEEHLSLETAERTDRYLKITVFNADSSPLTFGRIFLSGIRRIVKFPSAQPGNYVVYVGNQNARTPSYDFARVMPPNITPSAVKLGDLQPNPLFRVPERPWTDRSPWILNGTLIVSVVIMGFISVRMLRKIQSP